MHSYFRGKSLKIAIEWGPHCLIPLIDWVIFQGIPSLPSPFAPTSSCHEFDAFFGYTKPSKPNEFLLGIENWDIISFCPKLSPDSILFKKKHWNSNKKITLIMVHWKWGPGR